VLTVRINVMVGAFRNVSKTLSGRILGSVPVRGRPACGVDVLIVHRT